MPLLKEREYARLYFSTSRNVFKEMYFFYLLFIKEYILHTCLCKLFSCVLFNVKTKVVN